MVLPPPLTFKPIQTPPTAATTAFTSTPRHNPDNIHREQQPPYQKQKNQTPIKTQPHMITKRKALLSSSSSAALIFLFAISPISATKQAARATENSSSFLDFFRMTVPDQTVEEAEGGIRDHATRLIQVKELLESESWNDAQKELRKSSSYLKQDIYTIIQAKPGMERAQLRNLYSGLFNSVLGLDYAARDKDRARVWKCYDDIVVTLNDILSRIL